MEATCVRKTVQKKEAGRSLIRKVKFVFLKKVLGTLYCVGPP